jgi:hypothetical protein
MLTLNDFSGGLNTKSSPRDIAFNQVQLADNIVLSNPGLITSSKDADDKSSAVSKVTTSNHGNGAFIYNHEFDISDDSGAVSQTAKQIIAYPDGNNLEFFHRNFNSTGNFADADTANDFAITDAGTFEPVYYYVDGVLYIGDKDRVDTSGSFTQKSIQLIESKPRFGTTPVASWVSGDAAPTATTDAIFQVVDNNISGTITLPTTSGNFSLGFNTFSVQTSTSLENIQKNSNDIDIVANPNASEQDVVDTGDSRMFVREDTGSPSDITALADIQPGKIIFINSEAVQVTELVAVGDANNTVRLQITRGVSNTPVSEHAAGTPLKKLTSGSSVESGGAWESGTYEFTYSLVDYSGDETLPHSTIETPSEDALIVPGGYFKDVDVRVRIHSAFREKEKGFRIYTRIKDSNDRFILFLDVDYERGVRKNLFEQFTSWSVSGTYDGGSTANAQLSSKLQITAPALDTYESINGYSQEEKNITLGTKGGYKAAAVCARRAWIANVRKDDVVYDDRVYYSPVNRFATFPDSYYLDIGINDGDSFTALHSLGNRLLAFKNKKLYVINVSSTSDAGWYLEAEYDGVGCRTQESVLKTPFGICWVNDDGIYIFDGNSQPVELSLLLNDNTFRTNSGSRPAIGYNPKYRQLVACQDTSSTDDFLIYDFQTKGWSVTKSMSNGMSNFIQSSDGLYFIEYASSGNNKTIKLLSGDLGVNQINLKTKDIDFDSPGKIKKVYKVYITAKDDGQAGNDGNTLTLQYALNGSESFGNSATATPNSDNYTTLVYTLNVDCESIAFQLTDEASETISINDITIEYREKYKRAS